MKTSEELLKTTMNHHVNSQMHDYLLRLHFGSCPVRTPDNQEIPKECIRKTVDFFKRAGISLHHNIATSKLFKIHKLYQIDFHMNRVVAVEN
jgi:acid phosphatase class B